MTVIFGRWIDGKSIGERNMPRTERERERQFLIQNQQPIFEDLRRYTVPWAIFPDAEGRDTPEYVYSGILCSIGPRFFLLSAGHCVADLDSSAYKGPLTISIAHSENRIGVWPLRHVWVVDNGGIDRDFGLVELPEEFARKVLEARDRAFLDITRIHPISRDELLAADMFHWMLGYPEKLYNFSGTLAGTKLTGFVVEICDEKLGRPSALTRPTGRLEYVDVCVPNSQRLIDMGDSTIHPIPPFEGGSGCGLWIRYSNGVWGLVGTLSSGKGDEGTLFYRFNSIGYHLATISMNYSDLRETIDSFYGWI